MMSQTKFSRNRSNSLTTVSTNLHFRTRFLDQEIGQVVNNTIIPFVTTKFQVIPKINRKRNYQHQDNQGFKERDGSKLACIVIAKRLQKLVRISLYKKFLNSLRKKTFKQKFLNFLTAHNKMLKDWCFDQMKTKTAATKLGQKISLVNFVNKKFEINSLSYAFRKMIIFQIKQSEKRQQKQRQKQKTQNTQQKKQISQMIQISQPDGQDTDSKIMKPSSSVIYSASPLGLKPDQRKQKQKNLTTWRVYSTPSINKFQNV